MENTITRFDRWLEDSGPAALTIREHLVPIEGPDGVLFPPTFVDVGYNIDEFPQGGNVCLIDSVGSQANRIEPIFAKDEYASLVPQIRIRAGEKIISLLEAGHRAGDAVVRCTELQSPIREAFLASMKGNAEPLAKIAPTSIVFGAWDSRDTQAKLPRLVASTIRAFNVRKLRRSAQYIPALPYVEDGLLPDPADKGAKDAYAERGFLHVPAAASHGGIIADGGIRRDGSLHLACLRLLGGGGNPMALRRYILGLALTAFTYAGSGYLRQGCHLVADPAKKREFHEVYGDGRRTEASVTHAEALEFARIAAQEFGVGKCHEVIFSPELAQKDVAGEGEGGGKKKKAAKGGK